MTNSVVYLKSMQTIPAQSNASENVNLVRNNALLIVKYTKQYSDIDCLTNSGKHKGNQFLCSQNKPLA